MLIIGNKVLHNKSYSQSDENFDSMLREDSSFDLKWESQNPYRRKGFD